MMAAKLRKLQNRAEINRAQREIQNRQKKKMKRYGHHTRPLNEFAQNYQTIYKKFIENKQIGKQIQELSDDQDKQSKTNHKVAYISQLKRHPLLLEYTLQKINSKQKIDEEKADRMNILIQKYKKQGHQITKQYSDMLDQLNKKKSKKVNNNPEQIMESRFNKFYSKKSSDRIPNEIKSIPRCSKLIDKQNQIVSQIEQRSISKENRNKLRSRLNQIILSISKSQKLSSLTLPKIPTSFREEEKGQKKVDVN